MTAIRSVRASSKRGGFAQILNTALQDPRLTIAARGILAFIISLPEDKHFTAEWLASQVPDGERAIRSALRNLEEFGYYQRTRTSCNGTWTWEMVVSDEPVDNPAPMTFSQVSASGKKRRDAVASGEILSSLVSASSNHARNAKRGNKELNTEDPNTKDVITREDEPNAAPSGDDLADMIILEVGKRTGTTITRADASKVAREITGRCERANGTPPTDPFTYIRGAIRRDANPQNFVPTNTPPPYRPAPAPARPPVDADPWASPPGAQNEDPPPLGVLLSAITRERMTGGCAPTAI